MSAMREALRLARRAIGAHNAPVDCYATGPDTGDPIQDLVACPACAAIPAIDAALSAPDEADELREALRELHGAAKRVSDAGAQTGPQWSSLTVALLRARALLSRSGGG